MIKPILVIAIAVVATLYSNCFCQDDKVVPSNLFDIEISKPYQVINAEVKRYFETNGGVVSVKMNSDGLIVQKFAANTLNQEYFEVFPGIDPTASYVSDLQTNDHIYFFYSIWNEENQEKQVVVRKINLLTGKIGEKSKRLVSIKGELSNKFHIKESIDHSKFMISYGLKPEKRFDKTSKGIVGIHVFNKNDLTKIWGEEVEMPYPYARTNNLEYTLDNNANAYILSEILKEGETDRFDNSIIPTFDIQLIKIGADDKNALVIELNTESKFINQIGFFEGRNNELLLAGYYSNMRGFQVDGVFMIRLNSEGEQLDFETYEIPTEIIKQYSSERVQKKIDKLEDKGYEISIRDMVLREVVFQDDGSVLLAGERCYIEQNIRPNTIESSTSNFYKEILIAKISTNGKLEYMQKLPKNQFGSDFGFKLISSQQYFYFIFMDNDKNMSLDTYKTPEKHLSTFGGFLTAYQVEKSSGQVEKLSIFDNKDLNGTEVHQFSINKIVEIGKNQIAIEFYKKKKEDVMIKITIED